MDQIRKPFTGVWNIIRFNWHFYVLALLFLSGIFWVNQYTDGSVFTLLAIVFWLGLLSTLLSLVASFYVYDVSDLYQLKWLDNQQINRKIKVLNINAGFDETSNLLIKKYPNAQLHVFDFYDPLKHTEISIKRARKAYPPFPGTQKVSTSRLPLPDHSIDRIFAILSAHEIRNEKERIVFFKELKRLLAQGGRVIVVEHLRDVPNFLVYNFGFFHFHLKSTWKNTFKSANLVVEKELKITPFISTFILEHGDSS